MRVALEIAEEIAALSIAVNIMGELPPVKALTAADLAIDSLRRIKSAIKKQQVEHSHNGRGVNEHQGGSHDTE